MGLLHLLLLLHRVSLGHLLILDLLAWLHHAWLLLNVDNLRVLAVVAWVSMVSLMDRVSELHLSSSALGTDDHGDNAQDKADGSQGPPEPGEVDIVIAPAIVLAVSEASRAAPRIAVVVVSAWGANLSLIHI